MTRISVCIATYNGSSFIEQQLKSILNQLGEHDEIVLVDDCSDDSTLEVVDRIGDSRIRVYRNEINMGVVRSFERAMLLSTGSIIFLSDQDDVWHQDKIAQVMQTFEHQPDSTLVISDARIINEDGKEIGGSYFEMRGGFKPGILHNIMKNKYLGCLMAFRRGLLERALPFPPTIPGHDVWLGLVNALYGRTFFIDMPLVWYRRHSNNVSNASSDKHESIAKMLIWRWRLIRSFSIRLFSRHSCYQKMDSP